MKVFGPRVLAFSALGLLTVTAFQNCRGYSPLATYSQSSLGSTDPTPAGNRIYVAPNGEDSGPGTAAEPLATLAAAQNKVRQRKAQGVAGPVEVRIAGGTYYLDATLSFGSNDGGTADGPVRYIAQDQQRVVISGGRPVDGWLANGPKYTAPIPPPLRSLGLRNLYVGDTPGVRATRARYPKIGYLRETGYVLDASNVVTRVDLSGGDGALANLGPSQRAELVILKSYAQSRLPVASVSVATGVTSVVPAGPAAASEGSLAPYTSSSGLLAAGFRAYLEGDPQFVTSPGDWAFDGATISYVPRRVAELASVIAPLLEQLIVVDGASHLEFVNLEFHHTTWRLPTGDGYVGLQAGRTLGRTPFVPAGVTVANASGVRIAGCRFAQFGAGALEIKSNVSDSTISGNYFNDIGAYAITINNQTLTDPNIARDILVQNNIVQYAGVDYDGLGINLGYTARVKIDHNLIQHVSYSGISLGWFGMPPGIGTVGQNEVTANEISDVMMLYDDGGGIYTPGPNPGSRLDENYIHNIQMVPVQPTGPGLQVGLYFDGLSSGVSAHRNILTDLSQGVFFQNAAGAAAVKSQAVDTVFTSVARPLAFPDLNDQAFLSANQNVFSQAPAGAAAAAIQNAAGPDATVRARWFSLSEGVPPGLFGTALGIYRTDGATYCGFASWSAFVNATGRVDAKNIPILRAPPANQTSAGLCP